MNKLSLGYLLHQLSSLGLETLDLFSTRGHRSFSELSRDLCGSLLQLKGEASAAAIATELLRHYREAPESDKREFLHYLYAELGAEPAGVLAAIEAWQASRAARDLQALASACESPRLELLRTLNTAPGGTLALIGMRADLLRFGATDPAFTVVAQDLLSLFRAWFNRGFLELRRIDWRTPAFILEKLIQYESVHEITGWPDLRRRLASDRCCYAFFHPAIPDEPLIFVEAALTSGMSDNISGLLAQKPPMADGRPLDTAVFYSINTCLPGLRGVSFGNFLIKQVIEHLAVELPHINHFVTLSPVPGLLRWLQAEAASLDADTKQLLEPLLTSSPRTSVLTASPALQELLPRLCARYLVEAKSRLKPVDPVARFHLGNGARLERINWLADTSAHGLAQSAGLMVNYLYDRKTVARNHEAYEQQHEVVHSPAIRKLLA